MHKYSVLVIDDQINWRELLVELLEDQFDVNIVLADEEAMSQKNSPYRTIGTLSDYVALLLEKNHNG